MEMPQPVADVRPLPMHLHTIPPDPPLPPPLEPILPTPPTSPDPAPPEIIDPIPTENPVPIREPANTPPPIAVGGTGGR